jgi:hypothetical protein
MTRSWSARDPAFLRRHLMRLPLSTPVALTPERILRVLMEMCAEAEHALRA